jgi:3-hydroxyisobutyrate dehydrogenase/2-hydroxy-3-oxopropionate reductase
MGRMGVPMALRLAEAGIALTVQNRSAQRCDPLVAAGAQRVQTPADVARHADVIFTMLADGAAAHAVFEGADGLVAALRPGTVVVEMSTIGPQDATALAQRCAAQGATMLDAPVSGSITAAAAGTLLFMVGGAREAYAQVLPLLEIMSAKQMLLGRSGAGAAMKLAVNCVVAVTNQAISEALVLAEASGIRSELAYDVLEASAIASPFLSVKRRGYLAPEDEPVFFASDLMHKDLELAGALARAVGAPLPAAGAARRALQWASEAGFGDADFSIVAELLRRARRSEDAKGAPAATCLEPTIRAEVARTWPLGDDDAERRATARRR